MLDLESMVDVARRLHSLTSRIASHAQMYVMERNKHEILTQGVVNDNMS